MNTENRQQGFSLVEMMIAVTLASLITVGALSLFVVQDRNINLDEKRSGNLALSESSYNVLGRLLRHAVSETISIDYTGGELNSDSTSAPEINSDKIVARFSLPEGFPIWPNDKLPYDKPWVSLRWSNDPQSDKPYSIRFATASSEEALSNAPLRSYTSSDSENLIANLDLWPLDSNGNPQVSAQSPAPGGYLLLVTARAKQADPAYRHPRLAVDDPLAQYRTYTMSGVISPRN